MKIGRPLANFAFLRDPRRIRVRPGPGESRTPRAHRPTHWRLCQAHPGAPEVMRLPGNPRACVLGADRVPGPPLPSCQMHRPVRLQSPLPVMARIGATAGDALQAFSRLRRFWTGTRRGIFGLGLLAGGSHLACRQPEAPDGANRFLGRAVSQCGRRSRFESLSRHLRTTRTPESSSSRTPLADSNGILTPLRTKSCGGA